MTDIKMTREGKYCKTVGQTEKGISWLRDRYPFIGKRGKQVLVQIRIMNEWYKEMIDAELTIENTIK